MELLEHIVRYAFEHDTGDIDSEFCMSRNLACLGKSFICHQSSTCAAETSSATPSQTDRCFPWLRT